MRSKPGDLTYWPPTYWHVVDGDGGLNAALTLGVEPHADPLFFVHRFLEKHSANDRIAPAGDGSMRVADRRFSLITCAADAYAEAMRDAALHDWLRDELERQDTTLGLVTMCAAGGMAPAIVIERI